MITAEKLKERTQATLDAAKRICASENEIWDEISNSMRIRFIREAQAAEKEPRHD